MQALGVNVRVALIGGGPVKGTGAVTIELNLVGPHVRVEGLEVIFIDETVLCAERVSPWVSNFPGSTQTASATRIPVVQAKAHIPHDRRLPTYNALGETSGITLTSAGLYGQTVRKQMAPAPAKPSRMKMPTMRLFHRVFFMAGSASHGFSYSPRRR